MSPLNPTTPAGELRRALAERKAKLKEVAGSFTMTEPGHFTLTTAQYEEYKRVVAEAKAIQEQLRFADRVEATITALGAPSATMTRPGEPKRVHEYPPSERYGLRQPEPEQHPVDAFIASRPPPPDPEAAAMLRTAIRLADVRDRCRKAADSIDQWAEQHRSPRPRWWWRWWYAPVIYRELLAVGEEAVQARHTLALELRDRADLPDDLLLWLLGEGWQPPPVEEWHYVD